MQALLATPIRAVEFVAFDSESAGILPGEPDVPIQLGMAIMSGGLIRPESFFRSFLEIDRPVSWTSSKIHGITREDLHGAPRLTELWPQILQNLGGRAVVAHAAGTERKFLRPFSLHRFGPWIDTLQLARAFYPSLAGFKLGEVIGQLGLKDEIDELCPGLGWHDALYDAVSSLVFLQNLIRSASLGDHPLEILLHPDGTTYYRRQRLRATD